MHYCKHCRVSFRNSRCPRCGAVPVDVSDPVARVDDRPGASPSPEVSQVGERPSLAELVRQGLRKGYIQTVAEYAAGQWRKTS